MQTWSGLQGIAEVIGDLRPELHVVRDERGRELYDLPDAPRPGEDVEAPARFLPEFDSLVLAHADRTRIVSDAHRPSLVTKNLRVRATFLWDGFVQGTWTVERSRKEVDARPGAVREAAEAGRASAARGGRVAAALPRARRGDVRRQAELTGATSGRAAGRRRRRGAAQPHRRPLDPEIGDRRERGDVGTTIATLTGSPRPRSPRSVTPWCMRNTVTGQFQRKTLYEALPAATIGRRSSRRTSPDGRPARRREHDAREQQSAQEGETSGSKM